MTPQELKNSILQLAIQGKLVEQRPEEGTAQELYAQIQAEKRRLIKAGKLKKEKPLPPITEDEKLFEIPEGWMWVRFGHITNLLSGQDLKPTDYNDKKIGIPYITGASNIIDAKVVINRWTENAKAIANKGDLLLTCKGTVGKTVILQEEKVHIARQIIAITSYKADINFIRFFIERQIGALKAQAKSIIPGIERKNILLLTFPLPPLAEQKRIVAKIEELLPLVDRYEQAWTKLEDFNRRFPEELKKSILQQAIQGKLVEQRPEEGTAQELYEQIQAEKRRLIKEGKIKKEKPLPEIMEEEKPFEIPEGWMWVRLEEIAMLNPKNDLDDNLKTSFIPMTLLSDGYRSSYTYEIRSWGEIKKGFTHFAVGDIGIAKITPCFQNRKSAIFTELKNNFGAGTTELSIVRVIQNTLSRKYLLWFFKSAYFIENGVKSFTGTAGQQRIHKDYLSHCVFPLPPLAEQRRIVERVEELLAMCERLK